MGLIKALTTKTLIDEISVLQTKRLGEVAVSPFSIATIYNYTLISEFVKEKLRMLMFFL